MAAGVNGRSSGADAFTGANQMVKLSTASSFWDDSKTAIKGGMVAIVWMEVARTAWKCYMTRRYGFPGEPGVNVMMHRPNPSTWLYEKLELNEAKRLMQDATTCYYQELEDERAANIARRREVSPQVPNPQGQVAGSTPQRSQSNFTASLAAPLPSAPPTEVVDNKNGAELDEDDFDRMSTDTAVAGRPIEGSRGAPGSRLNVKEVSARIAAWTARVNGDLSGHTDKVDSLKQEQMNELAKKVGYAFMVTLACYIG